MENNNMEHDYMEDGTDYLDENHYQPSKECRNHECHPFCDRYHSWHWQHM